MSYLNISLFSLFSVIQLEILPATKFVAFLSIYLLNIKPPHNPISENNCSNDTEYVFC